MFKNFLFKVTFLLPSLSLMSHSENTKYKLQDFRNKSYN